MPQSEIKSRIESAVKDAMRAKEKQTLGVLRLVMAEFKKVEVDERIELDDSRVLVILDKMLKQRRDSLVQFEKGGRDDLVQQEAFEIDLIKKFMPESLDEAEILELIELAMGETGASSMKDMGKLMGILRPKLQGRADIGAVSQILKEKLS